MARGDHLSWSHVEEGYRPMEEKNNMSSLGHQILLLPMKGPPPTIERPAP